MLTQKPQQGLPADQPTQRNSLPYKPVSLQQMVALLELVELVELDQALWESLAGGDDNCSQLMHAP